jgi:hypothetical protein
MAALALEVLRDNITVAIVNHGRELPLCAVILFVGPRRMAGFMQRDLAAVEVPDLHPAGPIAVKAAAEAVGELREVAVGRHIFAIVVNGQRCLIWPLTIAVDHFRGRNVRKFNRLRRRTFLVNGVNGI